MRTKDFPGVKEAKKVVEKQLEFYNIMMASKLKKEENKVAKKKLYIVDTISTFRHRYVIEAAELEHAYDEVTMIDSGNDDDSFESVSQRYLGETIVDGREISKKDYTKMLKDMAEDKNEGCSHWMGDKLIRVIDYDR
jgi:hypothetical protein